MGLCAAFVDLAKAFDTVNRDGLWKNQARFGCPPKFLTIRHHLHEGQQGQVKHNGSLSDSFPISNGVKQGCVLATTLFSIFFSTMFREEKKRTYQTTSTSLHPFPNRRQSLQPSASPRTTIEELTPEMLFAEDCALLAHTEEALQHIVTRFSDAAKNFGLTISLKKTEVLYQPPPRVAYSPPHISIDGTNQNAVEYFTYLGSVISNDPQSARILTTA